MKTLPGLRRQYKDVSGAQRQFGDTDMETSGSEGTYVVLRVGMCSVYTAHMPQRPQSVLHTPAVCLAAQCLPLK